MKYNNIFSPNFDKKKRSKKAVKAIVFHYTGMQSEGESLSRLIDPKSKVSSHFLINRAGRIYRLVREYNVAWHAGRSCWGKIKNLNKNSIGIELINKGHQYGYSTFKKEQLLSLIYICKILIKKYGIKKYNIIGHSDIAPLRKIDPGEKFPWREFANKKIGIWHNYKPEILKKLRKIKASKKDKIKFTKNIKKIGYCLSLNNKLMFIKTVEAFQRHYRKELIDGYIDKECSVIAENLSKKC